MVFTIPKEPGKCYINIYLLCSDKLEFAFPGYFIQPVKVDRKANEPSAQFSTTPTG